MNIEAPQQRVPSKDENDKCINASFQVIEANGYHPDVYSSASWGNVYIPWSQIKWVARCQYHVTRDELCMAIQFNTTF